MSLDKNEELQYLQKQINQFKINKRLAICINCNETSMNTLFMCGELADFNDYEKYDDQEYTVKIVCTKNCSIGFANNAVLKQNQLSRYYKQHNLYI